MIRLLAVIFGCLIGISLTVVSGENPLHVANVLFMSAFGSSYDFGMTLYYSSIFILSGLSVVFAFRSGLFNIGAEGQLTMGALGAALMGIFIKTNSHTLAVILGVMGAFLFGALWGAISGHLKARYGSHEVITSIMLNYVAAGIISYIVLYLVPNPDSQNPESQLVQEIYRLSSFIVDTPVGWGTIMSVIMSLVVYGVFQFSRFGFEMKAVGENPIAAELSGIDPKRSYFYVLLLSGGIAGLIGVLEVMGNVGNLRLGFSNDYGFTGIAVALLARGSPLGVIASGLLFGVLQKGSSDLDFETETVSKDLSMIIQAIIILIACVGVFTRKEQLWKRFWRS